MATITSLSRWHIQPDLTVDGQEVSTGEDWLLILSTRVSNIAARNLLGSLSATNSYGWPIMGSTTHPDDSSLIATNYTISRDESAGYKFILSVNWTSEVSAISRAGSSSGDNKNYDYDELTIMEEIDIDPIEEIAIAASNGEPYWPKIQRPRTLDRIVVTRNEDRFKPSDKKRFRNKVNSSAINIDGYLYETHSILMQSITGKRQIDPDGNDYYVVRYVLLYDPDKLHQRTLLDVANGPDTSGTYPQLAGAKWNKPLKLDGSGLYASKAQQQDTSFVPTNTFNIYPEVSMSVLRL